MLENYSASSIGEILNVVRQIRHSWNPGRGEEELWFRGADKAHLAHNMVLAHLL